MSAAMLCIALLLSAGLLRVQPKFARMSSRLLLAGVALALAGCASWTPPLRVETSAFGNWPEARSGAPAPTRYAFERLPSQQAQPEAQSQLEALAAPALAAIGLQPTPEGQSADVLVQVSGRRQQHSSPVPMDPFWPRGLWMGPGVSWQFQFNLSRQLETTWEAGLLIRERASGQALFEGHASAQHNGGRAPAVWTALYRSALHSFPKAQPQSQFISVSLDEAE